MSFIKTFNADTFWKKINSVDNIRNENLLNVFTELTPFLINDKK